MSIQMAVYSDKWISFKKKSLKVKQTKNEVLRKEHITKLRYQLTFTFFLAFLLNICELMAFIFGVAICTSNLLSSIQFEWP